MNSALATTISSDNRDLWLAERRKYIGASDAPALFGLGRSALALYLDKRGMAPDVEINEAMEAGNELEESVLRWYGKRIKQPVRHNRLIHLSQQYGYLACTPDGFLPNGDSVQVKCSGRTSAWDEQIPDYVYVQVQAEMMCLGTDHAVALALVSGWKGLGLKPYDVGRDNDLIQRIDELGSDMMRRVREGDPPDPDGSGSAADAIKTMYPVEAAGDVIMLDIGAAEITQQLQSVDAQLKALNKTRDELRQRIQMHLGEHEAGAVPGGGIWTFKTQQRAGYTVEPSSCRVLRLSKKGK